MVIETEAPQNQVNYFKRSGVLMRRWRPLDASADEEWRVVHQVVVPKQYRSEILHLAHEGPLAGHLERLTKRYSSTFIGQACSRMLSSSANFVIPAR